MVKNNLSAGLLLAIGSLDIQESLLRRTLLSLLIGASGLANAGTAPPAVDSGELVILPLRWCVIEGSPAATDPMVGGHAATTDDVILQRMATVNDRVWTPGANISFRSAMPALSSTGQAVTIPIPVIPDPYPPGSTGVGSGSAGGHLGDIDYGCYQAPAPGSSSKQCEKYVAQNACRTAWNGIATSLGVTIQGPIAVNFSNFVNSSGSAYSTTGQGLWSKSSSGSVCADNWTIYNANRGDLDVVFITDNQLHPEANERSLAHELGHVLFLAHGNGVDTDGDGLSRTCDGGWGTNSTYLPFPAAEPYYSSPGSLMVQTPYSSSLYLTPSQVFIARKFAFAMPGATIDPPAQLFDGPVTGNTADDPALDVADSGADLVSVGIHQDKWSETTQLTFALNGPVPTVGSYEYIMLIDLDDDAGTGGNGRALGLEPGFTGADLMVRLVRTGSSLRPIVALAQAGDFVPVQDERIGAALSESAELDETGADDSASVKATGFFLTVPTELLPAAGEQVQFQAYARSAQPIAFDQVPDSGLGAKLRIAPPVYPAAGVSPQFAERGKTVAVSATGHPAGQPVSVYIGTQEVAQAITDDRGNVETSFVVPDLAYSGARSVAVRSGTVTAETVVGFNSDTAIEALPADVVPDRKPASKGNLFNIRLFAVLTDSVTHAPVLGRSIAFTTAGHDLCSAITDDDGVATCVATVSRELHKVLGRGYVASFVGDDYLRPSQARGKVVGIAVGAKGR